MRSFSSGIVADIREARTRGALRAVCEVDDATADALLASGQIRALARGTTLWCDGMDHMPAGIVLSGILRYQRYGADGQRQVVNIILPGELVTPRALQRVGYSMAAATDASFLSVSPSSFEALSETSAALTRAAHLSARAQLDRLRWHTLVLLAGGVDARICAFISCARKIMPVETLPNGNALLTLTLSRLDIADLLGTTVETLCRALKALERLGLIALHAPDRAELLQPDLLARRGELGLSGLACRDGADDGAPQPGRWGKAPA